MENIKKNMEQENQQTASAKMGNNHVLNGLKVRTITAKLRDAVIISLNEDIGEIARFKNIELPEALRDLSVEDYQFTKTIDGKLEFELYFRPGVLPKEMPEPRPKVTREEKAAKKAIEEEKKAEAPERQAPAPAEAKKPEAATTEPMDKKEQTPQAAIDTVKPLEPVSKEKISPPAAPATELVMPKVQKTKKAEKSTEKEMPPASTAQDKGTMATKTQDKQLPAPTTGARPTTLKSTATIAPTTALKPMTTTAPKPMATAPVLPPVAAKTAPKSPTEK